ncbi:MAG: hypothetical protein EF811_04975 [Methanonatronarchaeia archaeon]|nr:MAG: hypothetical protein EF811_04975 [Methanonatronarchaeia archaeon]
MSKLSEWLNAAGNAFNKHRLGYGIHVWKTVQKTFFPGEQHSKRQIKKMEIMHKNGKSEEEIEEVSKQLQAYLSTVNVVEQYKKHINSDKKIRRFKSKIKSMLNMEDKSDEEVLQAMNEGEIEEEVL